MGDGEHQRRQRVSSAFHHPGGGVVVEAHSLLAKPHAPGKEERLEQVKEKNAEEDQTFVSEAAAVVVAASTSEPDEESGLKRRPQKSSIHR